MKKLGPFELGKVHCVDCIEATKLLPDGCVDAVMTDPPYGIGAAGGSGAGFGSGGAGFGSVPHRRYRDTGWDNSPCSQKQLAEMQRVSDWQIIFGGNYFALPPASCWLIWDKMNGRNPFADCEMAWTNLRGAVRLLRYRWCGMIRDGRDPRGVHPTQKPEALIAWCLDHLPDKSSGLILDPFAGSGTTGVACVQTGRQFVGFEIDPEYCRIANERIAAAHKGVSLSEHKTGQDSMFGGDA